MIAQISKTVMKNCAITWKRTVVMSAGVMVPPPQTVMKGSAAARAYMLLDTWLPKQEKAKVCVRVISPRIVVVTGVASAPASRLYVHHVWGAGFGRA